MARLCEWASLIVWVFDSSALYAGLVLGCADVTTFKWSTGAWKINLVRFIPSATPTRSMSIIKWLHNRLDWIAFSFFSSCLSIALCNSFSVCIQINGLHFDHLSYPLPAATAFVNCHHDDENNEHEAKDAASVNGNRYDWDASFLVRIWSIRSSRIRIGNFFFVINGACVVVSLFKLLKDVRVNSLVVVDVVHGDQSVSGLRVRVNSFRINYSFPEILTLIAQVVGDKAHTIDKLFALEAIDANQRGFSGKDIVDTVSDVCDTKVARSASCQDSNAHDHLVEVYCDFGDQIHFGVCNFVPATPRNSWTARAHILELTCAIVFCRFNSEHGHEALLLILADLESPHAGFCGHDWLQQLHVVK